VLWCWVGLWIPSHSRLYINGPSDPGRPTGGCVCQWVNEQQCDNDGPSPMFSWPGSSRFLSVLSNEISIEGTTLVMLLALRMRWKSWKGFHKCFQPLYSRCQKCIFVSSIEISIKGTTLVMLLTLRMRWKSWKGFHKCFQLLYSRCQKCIFVSSNEISIKGTTLVMLLTLRMRWKSWKGFHKCFQFFTVAARSLYLHKGAILKKIYFKWLYCFVFVRNKVIPVVLWSYHACLNA